MRGSVLRSSVGRRGSVEVRSFTRSDVDAIVEYYSSIRDAEERERVIDLDRARGHLPTHCSVGYWYCVDCELLVHDDSGGPRCGGCERDRDYIEGPGSRVWTNR